MRLNNFISASGFCSRREADQLIETGRVSVNGQIAKLGDQVETQDQVLVDGKVILAQASTVTLAYYKPQGITCTTDLKDPTNIIDAIGYPERIFPIGRLDKDSEGLILLTNEGQLVNQILRAEHGHEKEYVVKLLNPFDDGFLTKMSQGIQIYNPVQNEYVVTEKCSLKRIDARTFSMVLTQGYNRQIRRMCTACGHQVLTLKRIRIMHIQLGALTKSTWKKLSEDEMDQLRKSFKP